MKKNYLLIIAISILFSTVHATEPVTWKLDVVHSNLGFSILHLGASDFKGSIQMISSTINASNEDFTDSKIVLEADMKTIDTDNNDRDKHLQSADFFDSEKYPKVTFQSTSFKKEGENMIILGDLSLHGITKPVKLMATLKSTINPVNNKPLLGIKVTGTIKRSDFDISKSTPVEILADEANIEANLEFAKE